MTLGHPNPSPVARHSEVYIEAHRIAVHHDDQGEGDLLQQTIHGRDRKEEGVSVAAIDATRLEASILSGRGESWCTEANKHPVHAASS